MPITVNDVYLAAMALCDYLDENGTVADNAYTVKCRNKSPQLCYAATVDLTAGRGVFAAVQIACGAHPDSVSGGESMYKLQGFMRLLSLCALPDGAGDVHVKNGHLCAPADYKGSVRVMYSKRPSPLKDLKSYIEADPAAALGILPYYLAADFLLEENPQRSAMYKAEYEKLKSEFLPLPEPGQSGFETIKDVY